MKAQPNRLPANGAHRLEGVAIDRSKPLSFTLNGRIISGFGGDTVLSAALASGLIGAGRHEGARLALDERFAPAIFLRSARGPQDGMAMERTPASNGVELVTSGWLGHGPMRHLLDGMRARRAMRSGSLALDFDVDHSTAAPWTDLVAGEEIEADLAIIGGGLAGLGAAVAAGKRGDRVVLVDRRPSPGGDARLFGSLGDAETPEALIERLLATLAELPNVRLLTGTDAFALFEGKVRAHQVHLVDGVPVGRAIAITAPRVVLAAGSVERLPVFGGNRLPGVVPAATAFDRAYRFGVWIGTRSLLSTSTNASYRVAMLARDAGIAVERIIDSRRNPQSRFIDFAKAYGIPLTWSMQVVAARPAPRGPSGLVVEMDVSAEELERQPAGLAVDQLLVSGGWQPDLSLWHMAGGASRWSAATRQLVAEGEFPGIALAGGAAGYRTAAACLRSGEAAVARLFGRRAIDVVDNEIEAIHETPDGATAMAPADMETAGPSYLDCGASLTGRPSSASGTVEKPSRPARRRRTRADFGEQARPLSIADVAAGVQLGAILPADAAIVAAERCVGQGDLVHEGAGLPPPPAAPRPAGDALPPYLVGRFGAKPGIWVVEAADQRDFEVGCLVYFNSEVSDAMNAVGAVFAPAPGGRKGGLIVARAGVAAGDRIVVRDLSGPVAVRVIVPPEVATLSTGQAAPASAAAVETPAAATPPPRATGEASDPAAETTNVNQSETGAATPVEGEVEEGSRLDPAPSV